MLATIIKYILPLTSISCLGLAGQALYAWIYPTEKISQEFLSSISDFYVLELIFMHSSVFWQGRTLLFNKSKNLEKTRRIKEIIFAGFLFLAYGLFIIPMYQKSPFLAWNYVALNILRLFKTNEDVWYSETKFYKKFIDPSSKPVLLFVGIILKTFCFALVLPSLVYFLGLPEFGLNQEIIKNFSINQNDSFGLVVLTKTMFIYFSILALYDLYIRLRKPKSL